LSEIVEGDGEPTSPDELEDPEVRKRGTPYTEREYAKRKPIPKYQPFKAIETQCLSAGASKKNLHTYVLCSGILYGHGEDVFLNYFRVNFRSKGNFLLTIFPNSKLGYKNLIL